MFGRKSLRQFIAVAEELNFRRAAARLHMTQPPLTQAMLSETYMAYEGATPTVAPGWFGCFDAQAIGAALERGEALAFLSEAGIAPKIDRVVAVFPDGRAFAWHQVSPQAEE